MKKYRNYIGWVAGLALISVLFIYAGPSIFQRIAQANLLYLFFGLCCTLVIISTTTYRWRFLLQHIIGPSSPSFVHLIHYVLLGATVGLFLPRDVSMMGTRIGCMKLYHEASLKKVVLSVFMDHFFDVLVLIPFVIGVLPFLSNRMASHVLLGINLAIHLLFLGLLGYRRSYVFFLVVIRRCYPPIYRFWERTPVLRRIRLPGLQAIELLTQVLSPRLVVSAYLYSLVKYLSLIARAFFVASAMNLEISFRAIFVSMPLAQASLIVAFTPGGLGIGEMGWYGALMLFGADAGNATSLLLGHRVFTYLFILILALVGQVVYAVSTARENRSVVSQ